MPTLRDLGLGSFTDEDQVNAWMRSLARVPATILGGPVDMVNSGIGLLDALGGGKGAIKATDKPVMEGIAKGGLPELKLLRAAGIVPAAFFALVGGKAMRGDQEQ